MKKGNGFDGWKQDGETHSCGGCFPFQYSGINYTPMKYKRFNKNLPQLEKKVGNAGYDLYAAEEFMLTPGATARIPLNIATEIPVGHVGFLFQRSSTFEKWGIKLTNNVGVIDSLYCGDDDQWKGEFRNETTNDVYIKVGDKICQAVFIELANLLPYEADTLGNDSRGGFGTSGNR